MITFLFNEQMNAAYCQTFQLIIACKLNICTIPHTLLLYFNKEVLSSAISSLTNSKFTLVLLENKSWPSLTRTLTLQLYQPASVTQGVLLPEYRSTKRPILLSHEMNILY